ncbi:MAG: uridine kinase [Euryarchaeota archaeon]|nr:uridine kinase [Euryarchaeota archaeon]|tara:strand:+ start:1785 stop:2402 length:618 start_codon:yes stop_codon:yes gene_type:complete
MSDNTCKIIAISGGSGSGKTTLANNIMALFGEKECEIISQDNYYIDLSKNFDHDGGSLNFDHPEMLEFSLLATHLKNLKEKKEVQIPTYDFSTHSRKNETKKINPTKIILVDGILILNSKELIDLFDLKIFIDVSDNIRLERRMFRDINERERTSEGIIKQWENQVLPMHKKYVETSAKFANIIISGENGIKENAKEIYLKINKL